ncbi:MAG: alpha/beta hydrolase [Deltaproteobacteria bacterium]|nr:alpha/beta hydrolase [Deltaproteobacteria bacterium]
MSMKPYHPFRSASARMRYLDYYDTKAETWPVQSHTRFVNTAFGKTYVRMSGPKDAPPLVLLHGGGGNSLQWLPNIEALSRSYKVYAIDNIYDSGRSIYTHKIKKTDEFMDWLDELFVNLGLGNNIKLMGLSYGGWLTGQYALRYQERLDKIVLIAPGGTVLPIRLVWIFRAILCMLPHRYFTRNFMYWLLADWAKKDEDSRVALDAEIDGAILGLRSFKPKQLVKPTVIQDADLQRIKIGVLFLVGENEKLYSARKAVQRLQRVAPHFKVEIIPNAGHDLTIVQAQMVNTKILKFLSGQTTSHRYDC